MPNSFADPFCSELLTGHLALSFPTLVKGLAAILLIRIYFPESRRRPLLLHSKIPFLRFLGHFG